MKVAEIEKWIEEHTDSYYGSKDDLYPGYDAIRVDDVRALLDQLLPRWVPVTERLPNEDEQDERFEFVTLEDGVREVCIGRLEWCDDRETIVFEDDVHGGAFTDAEVTHWRIYNPELPEAPAPGKEGV